MALSRDYAELALRTSRGDFVRMHDELFLVGSANLRRPARAQLTGIHSVVDLATASADGEALPATSGDGSAPLVLPIRKVQNSFPSMITVGRTENNDIPLPDVTVSRFHAFFRQTDGRLDLGDAGSRNGTWVATRRLVPRGPVEPVTLGDMVRFGNLAFMILDAAGCWDELHKLG
jgi:hypothetical protein